MKNLWNLNSDVKLKVQLVKFIYPLVLIVKLVKSPQSHEFIKTEKFKVKQAIHKNGV